MNLMMMAVQRCFGLIVVMFSTCTLTFIALHLIPGDPVRVLVGDHASEAMVQALSQKLGLDQPLYVQFYRYVSALLQGDMGTSIRSGRPVLDELLMFFPATLELVLSALLLAIVAGVPLGILAAMYHNRLLDHLLRIVSVTAISVPAFWFGLGAIVLFYGHLHLLPGGSRLDDAINPPQMITGLYLLDSLLTGNSETLLSSLKHLLLPVVTLACVQLGTVIRQMRAAMLEQLTENYIRTACANGLPFSRIILHHALPNSIIPSVTILGLTLGDLLYGAILTETVFSWPGMGNYVVSAIQTLDFPVVMGFTLVVSLVHGTINLLIDLLYIWIDPRIKFKAE